MQARGEIRPLTRAPSEQQKMMLSQSLENKIWRSLAKLASNQVAQETSKGQMPRAEMLYRKIAFLTTHGFAGRTEAEKIVEDLRDRQYYVKPSHVEDDLYELTIPDETLGIDKDAAKGHDLGDPNENMLNSDGDELDAAVDLVVSSMPKWLAKTENYFPRRRAISLILEANARIPLTERADFCYLVRFFYFLFY
jgi:hypothetical protein